MRPFAQTLTPVITKSISRMMSYTCDSFAESERRKSLSMVIVKKENERAKITTAIQGRGLFVVFSVLLLMF